MKLLRIGTRGSALALWQANHLRDALAKSFGVESEIVVVKTSGDRFAAAQIEQIGIRGIFTKELEDALIDGRADLAVHSMKDVPTEFSPVCKVAVVFRREDPRDALVSQHGESLSKLPQDARIGTSSLRRASQLRQFRSDLEIVEVRGNVDTRLRKVAGGEVEGMVLAKAGIDRLNASDRIAEILPPEIMLPAVGQGALGLEFLASRADEFSFVKELVDSPTSLAVSAERMVLANLQGGCRLPLGRVGTIRRRRTRSRRMRPFGGWRGERSPERIGRVQFGKGSRSSRKRSREEIARCGSGPDFAARGKVRWTELTSRWQGSASW